jgi:acetyl esterase/lipase
MELVIITLVIIGLFFVIFSISFYPFVKGFRFLNKRVSVNLGILGNRIKSIKEKKVKVKMRDFPDVEVLFSYPQKHNKKLPVLMFVHGGGWIGGSARKVNDYAKLIASYGVVVANVEYSLAPEYQYPVSTMQLVSVLRHIYNNRDLFNIDKNKIFIGGTSAGAHLTSQLGCLSSNKDYREMVGIKGFIPKVCGLILINGVYNFETVGDCHFPGMSSFIWSYIGDKDYLSFERINELSTINYVTNNYPNVFITVGDKDPLRTQSYEFVEVLKKNNVSYKDKFFKDNKLNHDFVYLLSKKEARDTLEEMIKFIKE